MVSGLVVAALCASAWAGDHGGYSHDRGGPSPRRSDDGHRGAMHHYQGDHWVKVGWFGFGAVVGALTAGAMIDALPPRYTTVVVGSEPYYYYDGTYFRPTRGGYVVVPPPAVSQQVVVIPPPAPVVYATPQPVVVTATTPVQATAPVQPAVPVQGAAQAAQDQTPVTINIPNDQGTYTPVTLRRSGTGFIGPQNEYYPEFPRVEQLRLMYGK